MVFDAFSEYGIDGLGIVSALIKRQHSDLVSWGFRGGRGGARWCVLSPKASLGREVTHRMAWSDSGSRCRPILRQFRSEQQEAPPCSQPPA